MAGSTTLHTVLTKVATVVGAGVDGLAGCHWPPPEIVAQFPAGILMPLDWDMTMGQREILDDRFVLDILVERDNLEARLAELIPLREDVIGVVRNNIQLGGLVDLWAVTGGRFATLAYNGEQYPGLRLAMTVRYSRHVTLLDGS